MQILQQPQLCPGAANSLALHPRQVGTEEVLWGPQEAEP